MNNLKPKTFITERDMEIFYALTKYHLTGEMIFDLSKTFKQPFASKSNARARLNELYLAGFLKRDERLMKGRGNNQFYYFLTQKSASLLPELEGIGKKNVVFQRRSFARQAHSFLVSEVMVKLENDCYAMKDLCRLMGFVRENYFEVKGEKESIRPDGTIFLNINGQNHLLFLEADRSTEIVASPMPNKRTFERKIQIYSEFKNRHFWQNEIIHQNFGGIRGYRVLIICRSQDRLKNLLTLAKLMNKESMFCFITREQFLAETKNCLFNRIWTLPNSYPGELFPLF